MTASRPTDLTLARRVDQICTEFDAAWQTGTPPRLEDYLERVHAADQAELLPELVLVELCYRRQRGEEPRAEEYMERFPHAAATLRDQIAADQALERNGSATAVGTTQAGPDPLHWPEVPGYEIVGELGRGGMGVVYNARHQKLNRTVALKMILSGGHAAQEDLVRFLAEAETVAGLQHPNLVQLYEFGEHGNLPYFTLEYVAGGSLQAKLREGPLLPKDAACIIEQLARGMHYAHQHGVVHRDLKPANILLADSGQQTAGSNASDLPAAGCRLPAVPKITDFGLVKHVEAGEGLTSTGAIMGTPQYMAPEQASGEGKRVGPAADIYALGAILYECLTGRPPFQAPTTMDTLLQVVASEPVPPRRLQPNLPRDLETICLNCLHKEPHKRYASAEALAEDLRRFRAGEPIRARPVGQFERAAKWVKRHPAVSGLSAVVVLVTLAGLGGIGWAYGMALHERNVAQGETRRADDEAAAAWANQYIAHANLMASDWENANLSRIQETLNIYRNPPPGRKDLRGWEWDYQERLCNHELRTLKGHTNSVGSVAFSPDGTRLATASYDNTVKLWDAGTSQVLRIFTGHTNGVPSVVFSPDGTRLASASHDKTVILWDVDTGKILHTLRGHTGEVYGVAFSPDGTHVASASNDKTVKLWDAGSGKELHTLEGHKGVVRIVAFSPDGMRLASAGFDKTVKLWDVGTCQILRTLKGHTGSIYAVAFSPDGTQLASASNDGTLKLWPAGSDQALRTFKGHAGEVHGVAFSPDGTRLASASHDHTVRLWDIGSGEELHTLKGHTSSVFNVTFSPDGTRLASASYDQTVKLWDAGTDQEPRTLKGHADTAVNCVAFSPDGTQLASASADKTVKLWDTSSGQEIRSLKGHKAGVRSVAFNPDGKRLASASADKTVNLWDAGSGKKIETLIGHTGLVNSVAFSPDGTHLASASADRTVKLWDAGSGTEIRTLIGHTGDVRSVAFNLDGTRLVSASADKTVKVWDSGSGQEIQTLMGHAGLVNSVALSLDGTRLAYARYDNTLRLWDTDSGQELRTLKGHTHWVMSAAFNPDGTRLASASNDRTVKLWDTASGQELRTLKGHTNSIYGVAFSRDGTQLASASLDGTIKLWDGRPLTPAVKTEVEAVGILHILFARPLPAGAVRAAIQKQVILTDAARQKALELADRFHEQTDPEKYHAAAWPVMQHPHANVFMAQIAVAQLEAACERAPQDEKYRRALGIAHCRLGKFQKDQYEPALACLTKSDQQQPATLAFLAMAQHQLGRQEKATATLARLQQLLKTETWAKNPESRAFLAEAEALLQPAAIAPKK